MKKIVSALIVLLLGIAGSEAAVITYLATNGWNGTAFQTMDAPAMYAGGAFNHTALNQGTNWLGQSFNVADSITVGAIQLFGPADPGTLTFSVNFYAVTDVSLAQRGLAPDNLINGASLVASFAGLGINGNYQAVSFPTGTNAIMQINLDASEYFTLAPQSGAGGYLMQVVATATTGSTRIFRWTASTDMVNFGYAGGSSYSSGGNPVTTRDFSLALVAVPEPDTIGLFGVSALCVGIIRRYIRR